MLKFRAYGRAKPGLKKQRYADAASPPLLQTQFVVPRLPAVMHGQITLRCAECAAR